MGKERKKDKKGSMLDRLIIELLDSDTGVHPLDAALDPGMKAGSRIPLRYRLIAGGFVNGSTLAEVNSSLVANGCEQLYARNPYEATLIYAFDKCLTYPQWKELLSESESVRKKMNSDPILRDGKLSLDDLRSYIDRNSTADDDIFRTGHKTGSVHDFLKNADSDRRELLRYLMKNTAMFSFVRESTRYYFCKYLMYFLETRKKEYIDALISGAGVRRAYSRLSVFRVQTALDRKNHSPAEAFKLIGAAPVSLGEVYDAFQTFYFEYTSLDWMSVLLERYDLDDLSPLQKKDVAGYLRNYDHSLEALTDEEVIEWERRELERREKEADERAVLDGGCKGRSYGGGRSGEDFLRKVLRGAVDIDRTTFLAFLIFFDKESVVPQEHRINEERMEEILSYCGFPKLDRDKEIDDFLLDYLNTADPMTFLLQEAEIMAMSEENFYLYKTYLDSKSRNAEWEKIL